MSPPPTATFAAGSAIAAKQVAQLQHLLVLDSGASSLPLAELVSGISLAADAVKRAGSIARCVGTYMEDMKPKACLNGSGAS